MLSTDFRRRKLVTLSACLCLQHVDRDTERRAVPLQQLNLLYRIERGLTATTIFNSVEVNSRERSV